MPPQSSSGPEDVRLRGGRASTCVLGVFRESPKDAEALFFRSGTEVEALVLGPPVTGVENVQYVGFVKYSMAGNMTPAKPEARIRRCSS